MKCLMSPPFSPISKAAPSSLFFCLSSKSKFLSYPTTLTNPVSLLVKPPAIPSLFPIHNRYIHSNSSLSLSSGEIHVIVGPMFAGKTTTLLRRIQSESSDGRFVLSTYSLCWLFIFFVFVKSVFSFSCVFLNMLFGALVCFFLWILILLYFFCAVRKVALVCACVYLYISE